MREVHVVPPMCSRFLPALGVVIQNTSSFETLYVRLTKRSFTVSRRPLASYGLPKPDAASIQDD